MAKFGFSLTPSSRINLDGTLDPLFKELVKLEPDVLKCMECGCCTATCTAGIFTPTSLRQAIHAIRNGQQTDALAQLKGCMLCGKCVMVCPRAINTRHLILSICKVYQK